MHSPFLGAKMKRALLVLVFLLICLPAVGQLPIISREVSLGEDVEIRWGEGDWETITVDSAEFLVGTAPTEEITAGLLGIQRFEADAGGEEICRVSFTLESIPNPTHWWGEFIRVRWRYRWIVDGGGSVITAWSPESNPKAIINLLPPGKPVW